MAKSASPPFPLDILHYDAVFLVTQHANFVGLMLPLSHPSHAHKCLCILLGSALASLVPSGSVSPLIEPCKPHSWV